MSVRPMTGMGGNKRKRCAVFDEKDESLTMVSIHCLLINIKYYTCKIRVANIVHLFNIKANFFYVWNCVIMQNVHNVILNSRLM